VTESKPGRAVFEPAALLLKNGADIRYVQELLGHVSIKSTQIYTRLNPTDLKGVHARFHPREKKALGKVPAAA